MYAGKLVFAQVMDHLPLHRFRRCVARHDGEHKVKRFSCLDQFLCMAFAQLTYRESLREVEVYRHFTLREYVFQPNDFWRAEMVHEAVHASFDLAGESPTNDTDEACAYLAETVYEDRVVAMSRGCPLGPRRCRGRRPTPRPRRAGGGRWGRPGGDRCPPAVRI
jgi:hypothetical protein